MVRLRNSLGIDAGGDGVPGKVQNCAVAHQQKSNWCWAAVAAGVVNSFAGHATDQDAVARRFQKQRYPDDSAELLGAVLQGERAMNGPAVAIDPRADPFGAVVRGEIDADRPGCAQISSTIEHYVAISGYQIGSREVSLLVQDPADPDPAGHPRQVPIDAFLSDYEGGYWSSAIRTKAP